ncbi:MAG: sigma-54 dependent transcriptional regulator [Verrucomicrobiota bacterium]|nr:sigma-54 dependent transcriptional regulator [Verrucomicrobiota bacterium]MDP7440738.1 sigma-54 dependent transcriptional regulator [Verrucomicrobiota bacterium]MDP7584972.1 sigma-54 dependent transcriptional regulator [Verrucomicrobiota bacterium]
MTDSALQGASVLLVEDEPLLCKQVAAALEQHDADVTAVGTLDEARRMIESLPFDFALLDVNLPDGLGTDLLSEGVFSPSTAVVVCTAEGGVQGAVEAIKNGAQDYLLKPIDPAVLPLVLHRARASRQTARLAEHERHDPAATGERLFFGDALGLFRRQLDKIIAADERLGRDLSPVLIEGETGTGKTSIARWLHHHGPLAAGPLVEVNCPALPESLVESELFGHERGAFTDAKTARMGLFEAAKGGTLFLDELASLSLGLQAKVLKAIEDKRIRRLGGNREIDVDIRIIAASNHDLGQAVTDGQFRDDLLHRLGLFRLVIPPLRVRGRDILQLTEYLLENLCRRHRVAAKPISADGQARLLGHAWPGNVRELSHELERTIVFEEGEEWTFAALPGPARTVENETAVSGALNPNFDFPREGFSLDATIHELIQRAIEQAGGNVSAAARLLGVSRDYIRYRLKDGGK